MRGKAIAFGLLFVAWGCVSDVRDDEALVGKIIRGFEGEPVIPRSANRIFIPRPDSILGLEHLVPPLLDDLRRSVSLDGRLGVESEEQKADLRLEIRITKYLLEGILYDELGRAVQKRIWITADVRLVDIERRRTIFFERGIQSFRAFSDLVSPIETEDQARQYALEELAKRIASKTATGWYTDRMTFIEKGK